MSPATRDNGHLPSATVENDQPHQRTGGFTQALLTILIAAHNGMAASRRYEDLRRQGLPADQAISRALAETGQSA